MLWCLLHTGTSGTETSDAQPGAARAQQETNPVSIQTLGSVLLGTPLPEMSRTEAHLVLVGGAGCERTWSRHQTTGTRLQ